MVPKGTRITFDINGNTSTWWPVSRNGIQSDVTDQLFVNFVVHDVSVENKAIQLGGPSSLYWNWDYKAIVSLTTKVDYRDIQDIDGIVGSAFVEAAGAMPIVTARNWEPGQTQESGTPWGLYAVLALIAVIAASGAVITSRLRS